MSTPAEHYDKADALMARVDEMKNAALPISVALTAQAMVHATLAQCDPYYDDDECVAEVPDYLTWPNVKARMLETRRATGGRL